MNRNYYLLMSAYFISSVGDWLYRLALPLLIYHLTHSPVSMAIAYALTFLPFLLVSLPGGVLADRLDRRKNLLFGDFSSFVLVLLIGLIAAYGTHPLLPIYIFVFLAAVISPIYHPAFQGLLPSLLSKEKLPQANALMESIENLNMFIAPIFGGVIIATLGVIPAIYFNAFSFLCSGILILLIRLSSSEKITQRIQSLQHFWEDVKDGFRYAWREPVLKYGSLLFIGSNFAINLFMANFMYFLAHILALSPREIGIAYAITGIGAIIGSFCAPYFIRRYPAGRLISCFTILAGLTTVPMLWMHSAWGIATLWGIVLWFGAANTVTYFTLRQRVIPSDYLGRAVAITRLVSYSSIPIASVVGGYLLQYTSMTVIIFLCALLRFSVGIASLFTPLNPRVSTHPSSLEKSI